MEDNKASIRVAERAGYRREPFALEAQIAESLRRPGFVRYATYRVDWMLDAAEES
jgi:RimJ/RimL family protein N-acetyltransferase